MAANPAFPVAKINVRYHGYSGVKHNRVTDRDSGIFWARFPTTTTDREIVDTWWRLGHAPYAESCSHDHDCCGCFFTRPMWIQRRGRFVIARQSFGTNI